MQLMKQTETLKKLKAYSMILSVVLICSSHTKVMVKNDHMLHLKTCSIIVPLVDSVFSRQQLFDSEGEGTIWVYSFLNGEEMRFCQGHLFEFAEDGLSPTEGKKDSIRSSSSGFYDDGKVWRIDRYDNNISIYYCRVPNEKKSQFDDIMDSIRIKPFRKPSE